MSKRKRTVLIGIDGAQYTMLYKISNDGIMPNFNSLKDEGVFKQMMASIPDNSAVSWSSIMTGVNPGEHGVFGFTDLIPKTYTLGFLNFMNMKHKPFWMQKPNKKYVILNLPFTYPVQEMNGYIISGFVSPDINRSVYPTSIFPYINKLKYQIDVDSKKAYKSKDIFLDELFSVHEKRVIAYRYFWDEVDWDTFMIVFTGSDRLGHFMWDDYENTDNPNHKRFLDYFREIDKEIGWISEHLGNKDNLIMMSDHGMEIIKTEVHLNTYLEQNGFLKLSDGDRKNYNNITNESTAFALEPSRIYLNYKDRYPNGCVNYEERENIIEELTDIFRQLKYNDELVITDVIKKEEIYEGDQMDVAPDLLLVPNNGYSLRGTVGRKDVFGGDSILTGMHKGSDAFLFVKGENAETIVPDKPHVEDVVDIMHGLEDYQIMKSQLTALGYME